MLVANIKIWKSHLNIREGSDYIGPGRVDPSQLKPIISGLSRGTEPVSLDSDSRGTLSLPETRSLGISLSGDMGPSIIDRHAERKNRTYDPRLREFEPPFWMT